MVPAAAPRRPRRRCRGNVAVDRGKDREAHDAKPEHGDPDVHHDGRCAGRPPAGIDSPGAVPGGLLVGEIEVDEGGEDDPDHDVAHTADQVGYELELGTSGDPDPAREEDKAGPQDDESGKGLSMRPHRLEEVGDGDEEERVRHDHDHDKESLNGAHSGRAVGEVENDVAAGRPKEKDAPVREPQIKDRYRGRREVDGRAESRAVDHRLFDRDRNLGG